MAVTVQASPELLEEIVELERQALEAGFKETAIDLLRRLGDCETQALERKRILILWIQEGPQQDQRV